ncbi:hypothetical protein L228DRAFT_235766 [Xylona heveae TC161]|uniref:Uncharacterized protein n=1 Tax=Xylona heveae (strain CBS 132557 / TC161) TaxID=1328760 RepID=A0A165JX52_XYLHT|nr:hypothetical protein L228DRAFT_235766 [Xylona heveae TC161]KZF26734.1 hypothetical protein L228DRAFT_235766 [Xylona heveae TC161]
MLTTEGTEMRRHLSQLGQDNNIHQLGWLKGQMGSGITATPRVCDSATYPPTFPHHPTNLNHPLGVNIIIRTIIKIISYFTLSRREGRSQNWTFIIILSMTPLNLARNSEQRFSVGPSSTHHVTQRNEPDHLAAFLMPPLFLPPNPRLSSCRDGVARYRPATRRPKGSGPGHFLPESKLVGSDSLSTLIMS